MFVCKGGIVNQPPTHTHPHPSTPIHTPTQHMRSGCPSHFPSPGFQVQNQTSFRVEIPEATLKCSVDGSWIATRFLTAFAPSSHVCFAAMAAAFTAPACLAAGSSACLVGGISARLAALSLVFGVSVWGAAAPLPRGVGGGQRLWRKNQAFGWLSSAT